MDLYKKDILERTIAGIGSFQCIPPFNANYPVADGHFERNQMVKVNSDVNPSPFSNVGEVLEPVTENGEILYKVSLWFFHDGTGFFEERVFRCPPICLIQYNGLSSKCTICDNTNIVNETSLYHPCKGRICFSCANDLIQDNLTINQCPICKKDEVTKLRSEKGLHELFEDINTGNDFNMWSSIFMKNNNTRFVQRLANQYEENLDGQTAYERALSVGHHSPQYVDFLKIAVRDVHYPSIKKLSTYYLSRDQLLLGALYYRMSVTAFPRESAKSIGWYLAHYNENDHYACLVATKYYFYGALIKDTFGMAMTGYTFMNGIGVARDNTYGSNLCIAAAKLGDQTACYFLAKMNSDKMFGKKDVTPNEALLNETLNYANKAYLYGIDEERVDLIRRECRLHLS